MLELRLGRNGHGGAGQALSAAASHAPHESFMEAVDPGYWPRAIGLRVVIAVCYVILVPAGLLPMSPGWYAVSGGVLLWYSLAMGAIYLRYGVLRAYELLSPYADTLVVTLGIVALAKPEYPIWMGYFLILPSLANFRSSMYVAAFSAWSIGNCIAAFGILDVSGRAEVSWALATIIAFMAAFTAINADIIATSNRKLRRLVQQASMTDPLTGLANRRLFRQVLDSHEVPETRPLAVLMYDVDNFKQINEERGHMHADRVLCAVAEELRACFREADVIARYGGDELIVLAHVNTVDEAAALGERSLRQVRENAGVTLSAGVSVYPVSARTLEGAVQSADGALREAKHNGKARLLVARAA